MVLRATQIIYRFNHSKMWWHNANNRKIMFIENVCVFAAYAIDAAHGLLF